MAIINHRPRLIHYVALEITRKKYIKELTPEDIEEARQVLLEELEPYIASTKYFSPYTLLQIIDQIPTLARTYARFPQAPRSYTAARTLLKDLGLH